MARSFGGALLVLLTIILINVYREHGPEGVRRWVAAKVLNKNYAT